MSARFKASPATDDDDDDDDDHHVAQERSPTDNPAPATVGRGRKNNTFLCVLLESKSRRMWYHDDGNNGKLR